MEQDHNQMSQPIISGNFENSSAEADDSYSQYIVNMHITPVVPTDILDIPVKIFPRVNTLDEKLCCGYYTCMMMKGSCTCCCLSCKDIVRVCCCRPCIKPKRARWNRTFDIGVSILSNTMQNIYPHKKSIPIVRLAADGELYPWLPMFPSGLQRRRGQKTDELTSIVRHEWVYPKQEGFPDLNDTNTKNRRFMLYLHGGGFIVGSPGTHRLLVYDICKATGMTALVIDYRRPPENPYPAPELDCFEAYKWLCSKVGASRVVLAGDSAGGALVLKTLVRARDAGLPKARCAILLSPWVDLFDNERESCIKNSFIDYIPVHMIPFAAQMFIDPPDNVHSAIHQNLQGLPPLMVEVGESEVLRDGIIAFIRKAQSSGVYVEHNIYTDMVHVFQLLGFTQQREAKLSFHNMSVFVDKMFKVEVDPESQVLTTSAVTVNVSEIQSNQEATMENAADGKAPQNSNDESDVTLNQSQKPVAILTPILGNDFTKIPSEDVDHNHSASVN